METTGGRALRGPGATSARRRATSRCRPGTPLVQLDAAGRARGRRPGERLIAVRRRLRVPDAPVERALANLESLRRLVLGFDVEPAETRRAGRRVRDGSPASDAGETSTGDRREDEILVIFARPGLALPAPARQPTRTDGSEEQAPLSAGEYFLTYLRDVDVPWHGPARDVPRQAARAVAHYGVDEPRADARAARRALLDLQGRSAPGAADRRDDRDPGPAPGAHAGRAGEPTRRSPPSSTGSIAATERRHPSLVRRGARGALPALRPAALRARARQRAYADAEARPGALAREPGPARARRADRRARGVPAAAVRARWRAASRRETPSDAPPDDRGADAALLPDPRRSRTSGPGDVGAAAGAAAEYEHEGRRIHLIATHLVEARELDERFPGRSAGCAASSTPFPPTDDVVLDLYVWSDGSARRRRDGARRLCARCSTRSASRARSGAWWSPSRGPRP